MPLEVELTDSEREAWLDKAAEAVVRRRLEAPAVFFLELHRPLSFLSSQALIVAMPFLAGLVGADNVLKVSKLLEDPRNVERLMDRIEEKSVAARAQVEVSAGVS